MSKKDELQAKFDELADHSDETLARLKVLKEQIKAEGKPVLRHGDYGVSGNCGEFILAMQKQSGNKFFYADTGGQVDALNHAAGHVVSGNVFDDLEALQEDVTEFEIKENRVEVSNAGINIEDTEDNDLVSIATGDMDEFILKLRQAQATLKRKQS